MPTIQQKRHVARIRRFFQTQCQGMTPEEAKEVIQQKFNVDKQQWYRIKNTLNQRVHILDDDVAPPQSTATEPPQAEEASFELSIPADLDEEAKATFNRMLGMINQQAETILRTNVERASLEDRLIKQAKTIQFLKSVSREMLDAI